MKYQLTNNDVQVIESNKDMNRDEAIFDASTHFKTAEEYMDNYGIFNASDADNKDNACGAYNHLIICLRFLLIAQSEYLIKRYDLHNKIVEWGKIADDETRAFYENHPEFNVDDVWPEIY